MVDLKTLGTILGVASVLVGGTITVESRYAKQDEVKLVEFRLDQKIQQDRYWWLKERLERIEKEYPNKQRMPYGVKQECQDLKKEIEQIKQNLEKQ